MIQEHTKFTPTERRGIIGLVLLACCSLSFIYLYDELSLTHQSTFEALADTNVDQDKTVKPKPSKTLAPTTSQKPPSKSKALQLQPFDPNQVSKAELKAMNLPARGINTFLKYRATGKVFYSIQDFTSVYGFETLDQSLLEQHLTFPERPAPKTRQTKPQKPYQRKDSHAYAKYDSNSTPSYAKSRYPKRTEVKEGSININTTDTSSLIKLKGIGEYRSQKIVEYREAIGGFYHLEQLYEISLIPDSVITQNLKYFNIDTAALHKIRINDWTFDQLRKHPYIRYKRAKALTRYIKEHGAIQSQEELSNIIAVDSSFVRRMAPYLDYD